MPLDEVGPEIVAEVGDDVVTEDEVTNYLQSFETDRSEAVDELIEASLFRQRCDQLGYDTSADVSAIYGPDGERTETPPLTPLMRKLVQADACVARLMVEESSRGYSGEELRTYYVQRPNRYVSETPWVEFVSVVVDTGSLGAPIGVPQCDRYLALYQRCVHEKVPEVAREELMKALRSTAETWRNTEGSEKRDLPETCRKATESAKRATVKMGCDWKIGARKLSLTQRDSETRILQLHASVQKSSADGTLAIRELPLRDDEWLEWVDAISGAELDPSLHGVLESLDEGELSAPFELDGTYRFALLTRRWPAGRIPFDVVAQRVELDLERDKSYRRERLLNELRERFEVRKIEP